MEGGERGEARNRIFCLDCAVAAGGFPGGSVGKESACNAGDTGDTGLIPGLGRSPGGGHGNSLQYSYLENPMDRGTWQSIYSP